MDNTELEISLDLKDKFAVKRHNEHTELAQLRSDLAIKLVELRDEIAGRRHNERIKILTQKFNTRISA